jgi:hypothetical protein
MPYILSRMTAPPAAALDPGQALLAGTLLALYLAPALIAWRDGHPRRLPITLFNLCLGWTFGGWIIALAWALAWAARPTRRRVAPPPAAGAEIIPFSAAGRRRCLHSAVHRL